MKDDLFEKIAQEIGEHASEVIRVHLYRDGEPLLDKRLSVRVSRLKRAGVKNVGISTNVELLTEDRASTLLWAGIDEIILSIDSMQRPVYEQIRVGLDFDKVIANARQLFRVRDELGATCKLRVRMIRQDSNAEEWASGAFQAEWRPYVSNGDTVEYRNIHNWGGQLDGFKAIAPAETEKPCIALWSLMTIFADGTVPMCNVDYDKKYPLGNVREYKIAELWRSQEQARRRNLHLVGARNAIPPCDGCTVWSEHSKMKAVA